MQTTAPQAEAHLSPRRRPSSGIAFAAAALVSALGLAGCNRPAGGPAGGVQLSGTCQFQSCVCAPDDAPIWASGRNQPVRWRSDGAADCPPGYSLKLGKLKS